VIEDVRQIEVWKRKHCTERPSKTEKKSERLRYVSFMQALGVKNREWIVAFACVVGTIDRLPHLIVRDAEPVGSMPGTTTGKYQFSQVQEFVRKELTILWSRPPFGGSPVLLQ